MARALSEISEPTGFAGRYNARSLVRVRARRQSYIAQESWERVLDGYRQSGYGYCDYKAAENHDYLHGSYGMSLAKPAVIVEDIEAIPDIRLLLYRERAWADHQNVFAIGKPSFDMRWPGMKGA